MPNSSGRPRQGALVRADPENAIQNLAMIRRSTPVRVPDGTNKAFEEGPLIVGYKVARQVHLPSRNELESQGAGQRNPFCQHDLGQPSARVRAPGTIKPEQFSISACPMKHNIAPVPSDFL